MSLQPNDIDYDRAVREYVQLATGLSAVVRANTNNPAPTSSYATVLMISSTKQGFNSIESTYDTVNDNIINDITSNNLIQYSIQIYRDNNCLGLIRQLTMFFGTDTGRYFLQKNNLVLLDWSSERDTSIVTDGEFENRASVDITFGLVVSLTETVNSLVSSEINIDLDDETILEDSINIT